MNTESKITYRLLRINRAVRCWARLNF